MKGLFRVVGIVMVVMLAAVALRAEKAEDKAADASDAKAVQDKPVTKESKAQARKLDRVTVGGVFRTCKRNTGFVLDREALAMVERAKPFPPLPQECRATNSSM